jgi:hypothetical protein
MTFTLFLEDIHGMATTFNNLGLVYPAKRK